MRIAAFNVENLFDRAKAFNEDQTEVSQNVFRLVGEFNALIEEDVYTEDHKNSFLKIMKELGVLKSCLLYTSPSPRDRQKSRMPSSA